MSLAKDLLFLLWVILILGNIHSSGLYEQLHFFLYVATTNVKLLSDMSSILSYPREIP